MLTKQNYALVEAICCMAVVVGNWNKNIITNTRALNYSKNKNIEPWQKCSGSYKKMSVFGAAYDLIYKQQKRGKMA